MLILTHVTGIPEVCSFGLWLYIQSSLHACIVEVLLHYDVNVHLGKRELCMESVEYSDSDSDRTHDLSSTLKRVLKKINVCVYRRSFKRWRHNMVTSNYTWPQCHLWAEVLALTNIQVMMSTPMAIFLSWIAGICSCMVGALSLYS